MMKPILTPEPIANTIIEQPEYEPITTEITYYIDGIPHTLTAHLIVHAALASERYADMIIYFKEYNDENCGGCVKFLARLLKGRPCSIG